MAAVRAAGRADADAIAEMMRALRAHIREQVPTDRQIIIRVRRLLRDDSARFLIAELDHHAVGLCQLRVRRSVWSSGIEMEIEDLIVSPSHRRRGIGRVLLDAAFACARRQRCATIGLHTNENNRAATALYASVGFSFRRPRWRGGRQLWLTATVEDRQSVDLP